MYIGTFWLLRRRYLKKNTTCKNGLPIVVPVYPPRTIILINLILDNVKTHPCEFEIPWISNFFKCDPILLIDAIILAKLMYAKKFYCKFEILWPYDSCEDY
jgi:hypothetical protein